jgi:hypothetical protein
MLSRKGSVRSIDRAFPYLARGCIVILAGVAIIMGELSVSTTSPASSVVGPIVDRSQKADRLQLSPTFFLETAKLPLKHTAVSNQALPDGCESVSSPLAHSKSAGVAARCLS